MDITTLHDLVFDAVCDVTEKNGVFLEIAIVGDAIMVSKPGGGLATEFDLAEEAHLLTPTEIIEAIESVL